jgi:hypothetical protein
MLPQRVGQQVDEPEDEVPSSVVLTEQPRTQ